MFGFATKNIALSRVFCVFFFNDTATTEIYTLSLHDALPIFDLSERRFHRGEPGLNPMAGAADRKSTRLNSSHQKISYAVSCLKKKRLAPPGDTPYPNHENPHHNNQSQTKD